jgi:putative thioredoxin
MLNVSAGSFQRDVVEASRDQPVLVDFWAPWCGPCRALGPMLEQLERDYAGRFRLVKINSDENPDLSAQFGVRSIPFVIAFVDGQPVDSFVGVLPRAQLAAFIERIVPDPSELERRKAAALAAAGDRAGALAALRAALALNPANDAARIDLAARLLEGRPDAAALQEARQVLDKATQQSPQGRALATRLDSLAQADRLPPEAALRQRLAADSGDLRARADLARRLIAEQRFEAALEELLQIVERDRGFDDDFGRRTMLAVFDLIGDRPEVVSAYRRRLAAALNR